ncbi:MAG TPA: hypothetical protein VE093_29360 [Polyangiaceae bacterium]|jgi:hypothetical protein|nr:hypothetical protein [Polyangiaceae bacterium]
MKPSEKESGEFTNWRRKLSDLVDRGVTPSDVMSRTLRASGLKEEEDTWRRPMGNRLLEALVAKKPSVPFLGYHTSDSLPSTARLSAEVSALRKEVAELKDEQRRSKEEIARWARALEQKLDELHGFDARDRSQGPRTNLRDVIVGEIRRRAAAISGVTAAYVNRTGTEFYLTGPEWTPELSEAGARIAVELQEKYAPDGDPMIDGGFLDNAKVDEGAWTKVFP